MRTMKLNNILHNRIAKNNLNSVVTSGAILIITLVVLFQIWASLVPEAQVAGDSLNDSNRCSAVGCFYNSTFATAGRCVTNVTSPESNSTGCSVAGQSIPLSSLFGGKGIVILLLMVLALFTAIRIVLGKGKK